jgi:hypothetical protein
MFPKDTKVLVEFAESNLIRKQLHCKSFKFKHYCDHGLVKAIGGGGFVFAVISSSAQANKCVSEYVPNRLRSRTTIWQAGGERFPCD